MKGYLRSLALVAVFLGLATSITFASATNIYIAQNPVGSANGADCADALGVNFFNASGDWGTGTGQIGPGTTVHLCGIFTGGPGSTMLTAQGSGASGSPITIKFESGTVLTAPYWSGSTGAINIANRSYIVVDGGTNGIIENTANGTGLANQQTSVGVYANYTTRCEVKNLTIENLYVHTSASDSIVNAQSVNAAVFLRAPGMTIDHNVIHDCGLCINGYGNNVSVHDNDVYNMVNAVTMGVGGTISGTQIYSNHFHNMANWDTTSDAYHKEDIHLWAYAADSGIIDGMDIYDNLFDGAPGNNLSGLLFVQGNVSNLNVFNNVFVYPGNYVTGEGIVSFNATSSDTNVDGNAFYNNTMINSQPGTSGARNFYINYYTHVAFQNNVSIGANTNVEVDNSTLSNFSNNVYEDTHAEYGTGYTFSWNGQFYATLSSWQSTCGCDQNSIAAPASQINVAGDGTLNAGSVAIGAGANLTGLGMTALDYDKLGVQRPSSGSWDAGPYVYGSSASGPPPPSGLTAAAQ